MEQLYPIPESQLTSLILNLTQGSFQSLTLVLIISFIILSFVALFAATYRSYTRSLILVLASGLFLIGYSKLSNVVDTEFKKTINTIKFSSKNFSFVKEDSSEVKIDCEEVSIKSCLKVLNLHQDAFPAAQNEITLSALPEVPEIDVN